MLVTKFIIPGELIELIDRGNWPRDHSEAIKQNLNPKFSRAQVRAIASDEGKIVLYPPPFGTVEDDLKAGTGLSADQLAIQDIVPALTVVIADFGMGSDTAIALDFRAGPLHPSVIRMQWRLPDRANRWLTVAESFAEFWRRLNDGRA